MFNLVLTILNTLENSSKCFKDYTKFKFSGSEKPVKTSVLLFVFCQKLTKNSLIFIRLTVIMVWSFTSDLDVFDKY